LRDRLANPDTVLRARPEGPKRADKRKPKAEAC
jgi:hypothetical protein